MPTTTIQHKRDTAAIWAASGRILATGQIGVETDTGKFKIGDGTNAWSALSYRGGPTSPFSLTLFDDTTAGAWLTTLGITSAAQTMLALSNVVGVRQTTVQLTNTQMLSLHTTAITVIAAAGSGLAIQVIGAVYDAVTTSGAYTNIDGAAELRLEYADATRAAENLGGGDVSTLLGGGNTAVGHVGQQSNAAARSSYENTALQVKLDNVGSGALTGGHASNTVNVIVTYVVTTV